MVVVVVCVVVLPVNAVDSVVDWVVCNIKNSPVMLEPTTNRLKKQVMSCKLVQQMLCVR